MGTLPENVRQSHPQDSGTELRDTPHVSVITALPVNTILAESAQQPKLLERVRALIRTKHYSVRTERIYIFWIKRFICFHGKRHPESMGKAEVEAFLSHLATTGGVAASTQNQALAALLFLYNEILQIKLPWLDSVVRAKRPKKLPVVLTKDEVERLLAQCDGTVGLFLRLLYGTGMRIMECATLRVKDIDFGARSITVRAGKGAKCSTEHLAPHVLASFMLRQSVAARKAGRALSVDAGATAT